MKRILATLCVGLGLTTYAQEFEISAELRPRFEYRHGFATLIPDNVDAAAFVSQRTRINVSYGTDKFKAFVAFQNIRVWGDVPTTAVSDKNGVAIHQAWTQLLLNSKLSLKFGRQEISYDDERLFGSLDWAQQARSHDALLVKFKPNEKHRLDLGLALSSEAETLFQIDYDITNYKNFQYLWYHGDFNTIELSFLALNNGFAFDNNGEQKVTYNQTFGSRITFNKNKVKADASVYYQSGKIENRKLSAYNLAANAFYEITDKFSAGLGVEYLSGTDMNTSENTLKSFNPWFGTNHKFNGLMDYFFVGNHINSVGLLDVNATLGYQKDKISVKLIPHFFSTAAIVLNPTGTEMSNALGTELDLIFGYKWTKDISFNGGYSQLFATETMEVLKRGNKDNNNNWAWLMITVKPSLFKNK